ncbi:MAG: DNA cytosine methyltransferase [Synergistaceae bacterium]|nr:DNA cytosine methyltransferase [Synergistaceae bacterium]
MGYRFIDLFAGIGGIRLAFEGAGCKCVFSSEIDEYACRTYEANFHERPSGDIREIDAEDIPEFEILAAGFPCQPFSIIGSLAGFSDAARGTMFFEILRILQARRPAAFMLENVKNLISHDKGRTYRVIMNALEELGYCVYAKVMNALDYGLPQKRERIIIAGFRENVIFAFPDPVPESERITLSSILESRVDAKYYVSEKIRSSRLSRLKDKNYLRPYISHENVAGSVTPHSWSAALRAGASANYILVNDERRPTERELLRLQGFPDSFKVVVPYGKLRQQCGNSVAVPMIKAVADEMIKALRQIL